MPYRVKRFLWSGPEGMVTEFTGGGDPRRSIELLWGVRDAARRGPKPRLSAEDVVRKAMQMADAEGLAALSMRKVAEALGVSAMALYTYVPSKTELIEVMLDRAWGEIPPPEGNPADETPGDWRMRLETKARQDWALMQRHPWMLQISAHRPPLGPNIARRYETSFRIVDGLGLSDVEMDRVISLVDDYVHGAVRASVEASEVAELSGMGDLEWWRSRSPLLTELITPEKFPTATRIAAACTAFIETEGECPNNFEFGLQRLLDGVAVFVAARQDESR